MEVKNDIAQEKRLVALVLVYIFGMFGGHRFYVGKKGSAVVQLSLFSYSVFFLFFNKLLKGIPTIFFLLLALSSVILIAWVFIDMVTILLGRFRNNDGEKLVEWT